VQRRAYSAAGWGLLAVAVAAVAVIVTVGAATSHGEAAFNRWIGWATVAALPIAAAGVVLVLWETLRGEARAESAARDRLMRAEQELAASLEPAPRGLQTARLTAREPVSDRLSLPALWEVTHSRLDLYHQIVTGQARRSFLTAQIAIVVGFLLLIAFAVLATQSRTIAGAITTRALGTVSAGLAGYISRTFIRSQESAAAHLHAYFEQPLQFARYLAAERLLADSGN